MAKQFDATLKELVQNYPNDWLAQLNFAADLHVEVIDADVSTVTSLADKVLRVDDTMPWILHLELQAGHDPRLHRRVLKYNVLLHERHELRVYSVIVLLRPEADDAVLTGTLIYQSPRGGNTLQFDYEVIRAWQQPVEAFLEGGLGVLPLAPICAVSLKELPDVIKRIEKRLEGETDSGNAASLLTSVYILAGLRFKPSIVSRLFQGVRNMKESSTYQAILKEGRSEGRAEELKRVLRLLGDKRFGRPDAHIRRSLNAMTDVARLEYLATRLLEVSNWDELLGIS